MADLTYTVDDYVREPDRADDAGASFVFRITADADPDVLSRVAGAFNFANKAPSAASLREHTANRVVIEVQMRDLSALIADLIRRKLLQLTCVADVELRTL